MFNLFKNYIIYHFYTASSLCSIDSFYSTKSASAGAETEFVDGNGTNYVPSEFGATIY